MQGYDEQTEVLTSDGWIPFKRLDADYEVATLVDGRNLAYEKPSEVSVCNYRGLMHRFKTANIDLLVTPDQKLWACELGSNQFNLVSVSEVADRTVYFELEIDEVKDSSTSSLFTLPGSEDHPARQLDMPSWLLLYGTFVIRGLLVGQRICLTLDSVDIADKLRTACSTLGFTVKDSESIDKPVILIDDPQLYRYLSSSPRALGSWVWILSADYADELLDNIVSAAPVDKDHGFVLRASYRDLIDTVQRLSVHAGLVTMTSKEGSAHQLRVQYRDDVNAAAKVVGVGQYRRDEGSPCPTPDVRRTEYRGKVYSCKVTSGVICVRRNGIVGFSGAS